MIKEDEIINAIELLRRSNNTNWMKVLRIALKYAPEETREVVRNIKLHDDIISEHLGKL